MVDRVNKNLLLRTVIRHGRSAAVMLLLLSSILIRPQALVPQALAPQAPVPQTPANDGVQGAQETVICLAAAAGRTSSHLEPFNARRSQGLQTELRVVVILADFPDLPADREAHPREYYEDLFFSRGTHPTGSVADFLYASSNGRLILTGDVRGWFRLPWKEYVYNAGKLGGLNVRYSYPNNSQKLAEDAIVLADTTINFADGDNEGPDNIPDSGDDDELVDGVIIIHAGSSRGFGSSDGLTAVTWQVSENNKGDEGIPVDGVFAKHFTLQGETSGIGLIIHELGHLMGLPELYDRTFESFSYGLGKWSMMGLGFASRAGDTPIDFDAWSKVQLGFADLVTLNQNALNTPIVPTQDGGSVYRLWKNGTPGPEYFLVEARRKSDLDIQIPGPGLLIYHVDEDVSENSNRDRYKVGLEQADALYQLEGFYDDYSSGDEGDPFVEGGVFSRYTNPNSFSNTGRTTPVAVGEIHGPHGDGSMTASLFVEPAAHVRTIAIDVQEYQGNGDGVLEAGEVARVIPRISIKEEVPQDLTMSLRSLDPSAAVINGEDIYLPAEVNTSHVSRAFEVELEGPFIQDPQGIPFQLELSWKGAPARVLNLEIGVGDVLGHGAGFDGDTDGWEHQVVVPGYRDAWFHDRSAGVGGTGGFRCGFPTNGIDDLVDAALVSPLIMLPGDADLIFDHRMDLPDHGFETTKIGGVLEISVNGAPWKAVVPDGGYSHRFVGQIAGWMQRRMFAGRKDPDAPGYTSVRANLSRYGGASVRLRFRLVSDLRASGGTGWHIDNVRIGSTPVPVLMLSHETVVEGEDLHLYWELSEAPVRTVVWRGESVSHGETVGVLDAGTDRGHVIDRGGATRGHSTYWLEFLNRDGSREIWGPWRVDIDVPLRLSVEPRGGATQFRVAGSAPGTSRLEIYDIQGRLIRSFPVGKESVYEWRGETRTGGRAASGVYFVRLSGTSLAAIKFVRVVR